ncbi:hypothetical protein PIB30_094580 [Stylosanthes scabra]|uniref:Uncharacterized protein n=1 Tax=Stylosanthes scabra TaxID=79078 RepID=A0ABU6ZUH3_9FABA|nr:hypothetical protein [Stylosanthes scabra]
MRRLISWILAVLGLTVSIRLPRLSLWLLRWIPTSGSTIAPTLGVILLVVGRNCSGIKEVIVVMIEVLMMIKLRLNLLPSWNLAQRTVQLSSVGMAIDEDNNLGLF